MDEGVGDVIRNLGGWPRERKTEYFMVWRRTGREGELNEYRRMKRMMRMSKERTKKKKMPEKLFKKIRKYS